MPFPLIPAIIAAISIAAAGKGVTDLSEAKKRIAVSRSKYNSQRKRYELMEKTYNLERERATKTIRALGKVRLDALVVLGEAVKFLKKAHIKERDLVKDFRITKNELIKWEDASIRAKEIISGLAGAGLSGVSTAAAAYGLVSILGSASTGTAIASLSGAAATNATLAWLGGGAVAAGGGGVAVGSLMLGGIVVGPAILAAGFFAKGKAEEIETNVTKQISKMEIAEAEMSQQLAVLKVILLRANELKNSTINATKILDDLLKRLNASSSNSLHRAFKKIWRTLIKYITKRDLYMEEAFYVARLAKGLGNLLDAAIIDEQAL